MAILSDINSALEKMDAALFQQLGDEMLKSIYRPINLESRGSKTGKAKTVKGSPDTILSMPDSKIMIEYTTQSNNPRRSFIKKLENDITSCLNVEKTKVPVGEIAEIILFVNQRIATDIQSHLRQFLSKISTDIKLTFFSIEDIATKLRDFPRLLNDYLRISTFQGLTEIDTYITRSSSSKFTYKTPLDNKYFEIETQFISDGIELLKSKDIIIISGDAGMGKTRYAIEVAKALSSNTNVKAFVIEERNRNIREILDSIDSDFSYLFIIDDANRTAIWEEAIDFYCHSLTNNVKFIATVRNYALDSILEKCSSIARLGKIEISKGSEDLTSKILTSFGITNNLWHKRINDITCKNIRLAVMCAQIAMAGAKYNELINVESIYNTYYMPMYKDLEVKQGDRMLIKVIAIISFYKIVDLHDDSLFEQIEEVFGIKKLEFISACHQLNTLECIIVTEYNIATIPDQNFGTYIFYQCFFALKELSLSNLIKCLYQRRERLRDSIFSVWNCFHKEEVIGFSRSSISSAWRELEMSFIDERDKCEFLEVFGCVIPTITFSYIKNYIQNYSKDNKDRFSIISDSVINILSHFSHSDAPEIVTALNLMVEYLKSQPDKIENAAKVISDSWLYDEVDYANSYKRLSVIIDSLIELSQDSETGFTFSNYILPLGLKFIYQYNRTKGRTFVFGRNPVVITDELKAIRKKIWKWINQNIYRINQASLVKKLYIDFYEVKSLAKELVSCEIDYVNEYIAKLNITDDFYLSENLFDFSKRLNNILGRECFQLDWSLVNPLYRFDYEIRKGRERNVTRNIDVEHKNIGQIAKSKSLTELIHLVDDICKIADLRNIGHDFRVTYVIESALDCNFEKGMGLWQHCIDIGCRYLLIRIILAYINNGYILSELIRFADSQKINIKSDLLLAFICIVDHPTLYITERDFLLSMRHYQTCPYDIDKLCDRYYTSSKSPRSYRSVLASIIIRVRNGLSISGSEKFLTDFCAYDKAMTNLIGYTYINGLQEDGFDYNHELLKTILQNNPKFWVDCCAKIPKFVQRYHIHSFEFIWEMGNYAEIIESTLLFYSAKDWITYDEKENLFAFFCNIESDKVTNFVNEMILKYSSNGKVINVLFEIIASHMGVFRNRHYITFINQNTNIDDFKSLFLFSNTMYGGDSFASAVKSRIEFVKSLIDCVKAQKDKIKFIDHLKYLNEIQESLEREYAFELKRGHKQRLYDM